MNFIKRLIGLSLIVSGVYLGIYWGVWCLFIGGIVQTVTALRTLSDIALGLGIAKGLLKVMISGFVGWFTFYILTGTGIAILITPLKRSNHAERRSRYFR
jgi:hypothetical protein